MTVVENSLTVSLPWQVEQWQRLEQLRAEDKLPHALLLCGPAGTGKRRFALALAQYLMCAQPHAGQACGECRQCGFNRATTHPDLKLLQPEEKARQPKGKSQQPKEMSRQIKVDQVRELVQFLGHTSQQGGYKVCIVTPAEAMNINASNALLKSLEEPAANTLLLLVSDCPSQLLPTIRSRCQSVNFPVPSLAEAVAWLSPQVSSGQQAEALLAETSGQPIAALDLLASDGLGRRQQCDRDFLALATGRVTALALAEKWLEHEAGELLGGLSQKLSRFIRFRMGNTPLSEAWQQPVSRVAVKDLFNLLDKVNRLRVSIARGANPNKQLALEALLLESCDLFHS